LKDFIFDQKELDTFQKECDLVAQKANSLATKNIQQFDAISQKMEENDALYSDYQVKRDQLAGVL